MIKSSKKTKTGAGGKIQVKIDAVSKNILEQITNEYDISEAELFRSAFKYYIGCREKYLEGYDIGAILEDNLRVRLLDPPYSQRVKQK